MENERVQEAQARINACKSLLTDTDYIIIKATEEMFSCETFEELLEVFKNVKAEYGEAISARKNWRSDIDAEQIKINEAFVDDFIAGKSYYKGDRVYFNGKLYECIAPVGAVCVWSPDDYPTYWKRLA